MIFNTVVGTGNSFATIATIYPEDSICTCSNITNIKMIEGVVGEEDGIFSKTIQLKNSEETATYTVKAPYIVSESYIPCVPDVNYKITAPSITTSSSDVYKPESYMVEFKGTHGVVFYDTNKNFISFVSFGLDNEVNFIPPTEAAYMRINFFIITQPETMYSDILLLSGEKEMVFQNKSTNGKWIFAIPHAGTWTVSCIGAMCTSNTDSIYSEICIDKVTFRIITEGQVESITFASTVPLFDCGNQNIDLTGGWGYKKNYLVGDVSFGDVIHWNYKSDTLQNSSVAIHTNKAIDLTNYNAIKIVFSGMEVVMSHYPYFGLTTEEPISITSNEDMIMPFLIFSNMSSLTQKGTDRSDGNYVLTWANGFAILTLDVSTLSGEYYPCVWSQLETNTDNIYACGNIESLIMW